MKTHQDLIAKILSSLGNGYLKLITGLVGTGKTFFLFHDLFNEIYKDKSKLIVEIKNEKEVKRTVDALIRRGHSWKDIQSGLRRYRVGLELEEITEDDIS